MTGSSFLSGSDDVAGRAMRLREWISVGSGGVPKLLVVVNRCPNLVKEFSRFKKKVVNGFITDDGNRRGACHAVETLEYAAANGLKYNAPRKRVVHRGLVQQILHDRARRAASRRARQSGGVQNAITLGPQGEW